MVGKLCSTSASRAFLRKARRCRLLLALTTSATKGDTCSSDEEVSGTCLDETGKRRPMPASQPSSPWCLLMGGLGQET